MRMIILVAGLFWAVQAWSIADGADTPDLTEYRWKSRLLLVFAPADGEPMQEQERLLKEMSNGINDRDLVIGRLHPAGGTFDGRRVSARAVRELRQTLRAEGDFVAVLIGKDGSVKARYAAPVAATELFPFIDAMPMRQREQRDSE